MSVALDTAAVVAFVVIGRASHHHGETAEGVAATFWPFGAGTLVGWALVAFAPARRSRREPGSLASGLTVTASTVALGMALREVVGQGTAPAFVAVAAGFLGAVMLGWRAVLSGSARRLGATLVARIRR